MNKAKATVVRYKLRKHNNADTLSIADIEGPGWQVVVRADDFESEVTAIYILVDTIVPEKPEFEFLRDENFVLRQ